MPDQKIHGLLAVRFCQIEIDQGLTGGTILLGHVVQKLAGLLAPVLHGQRGKDALAIFSVLSHNS